MADQDIRLLSCITLSFQLTLSIGGAELETAVRTPFSASSVDYNRKIVSIDKSIMRHIRCSMQSAQHKL